MNLADVMDDIGDRLDLLAGLRVYRYPPDNVQVPAAVVTYPETYEYDSTYARGMDRITLPVIVMVGKVSDRASRDRLGVYANGSGAKSLKATLEDPATPGPPIAFTGGNRTAFVVTLLGLPGGHGIEIGQNVIVDAEDDAYDGTFEVTGFDGSSFRIQYSQVGPDDPGSGPGTVRVASDLLPYTAFDTVRVQSAEFDVVSMAGVEHLAATFNLDIAGTGA